jgi:hypothetical protein
MRRHILVPGFAFLSLIVANTLPATARSVKELADLNAARSARHIDYSLVGSRSNNMHANNTHGQQQRIVIAKDDEKP